MTEDVHRHFEWTDLWGGIGAVGSGLRQEFATTRGWSVSDSHPFGVEFYEDINGTRHSVDLHDSSDPARRGLFEGNFLPSENGRYHGKIVFRNSGRATRALAGSHPEPTDKDAKPEPRIEIASDAPRFSRSLRFYFDSGPPPRVKDRDRGSSKGK